MPIDFNPIGLNIILPADIALLSPPYTNIIGDGTPANPRRIPIFGSTGGYIYGLQRGPTGLVLPDNPLGDRSGCQINGIDYFVTAHIGAGSFGSVESVRDGTGNEFVIKIQPFINETQGFILVREAVNNFLWQSRFPTFINPIHHIVYRPTPAGQPCEFIFLLGKKIMTLEDVILGVGNPVAYPADYAPDPTIPDVNALGVPYTTQQNIIGKGLKHYLCILATNLRELIDTLGGTHGDLKYDNIMRGDDDNHYLIDFGASRSEFDIDGEHIIIECMNIVNSSISESRDMTHFTWRLYNIPSVRGCSIDPILQGILTFAANPVIAAPYLPFNPNWYSRDMYGLSNHQIGPSINPSQADIVVNVYRVLNAYENANGEINVIGTQVCPPEAEPEAAPQAELIIGIEGGSRRKYKNRKRRYTRKYAKKRQIRGQRQSQKGRRTRKSSSSLH